MSEIVVVVPVLGRPHRAAPVVENLEEASPGTRLVFVCSPEDAPQIEACQATEAGVIIAGFPSGPGDFARKINLAYQHTHEPYLFQAADDVEFAPGWDLAALAVIDATETGVCGTNDEANAKVKRGDHATHSLIRREYIDNCGGALEGPGTVFSESYGHQYCDNELVELAKARGCWSFAWRSIVRHSHPMWGTAPRDATYEKGQASAREDYELYHQRKRAWEGGRIA